MHHLLRRALVEQPVDPDRAVLPNPVDAALRLALGAGVAVGGWNHTSVQK